ncbi:MAG: alpha/beta hydrolase [Acidimicrobiia bacterium]|nr:alpha/beta hydrolase [Acidimicrobiia bacterium]
MPRPAVRLLTVGACISLLALIAPGASAASDPGTDAAAPLVWHDCGDGFECSTLEVPVDYSAPDGEQVAIAVTRKPATDPGARRRSLVFNYGGPGDPGTETLRLAAETIPEAIRREFDLVTFDPRGTGGSRPIDCVDDATFERLWNEDGTPNGEADLARFYDGSATSVDLVATCVANQGDWLAHVGTRNVARDLDRLRAALGERRLTFVGYSYGTVLGAVYAQDFPEHVRALVLDSAVNLTESASDRQLGNAAGFEGALDAFLADCAADSGCAFQSDGDPRAALTHLRDRFEAGLTVRAPGGRTVGASKFYTGLLAALYSRSAWPVLGQALHDAARKNDGKYLQLLNDAYTGRRDDGTFNNFQEAIGFIVCADVPEPRVSFAEYQATYARLTAQFPFFGAILAGSPIGCDPRIPTAASTETLGNVRATKAPPVLVLGTTHDPATPYVGAVDLRDRLGGARVLTIDDTQHGGYGQGNQCVDDYVDDYLLRRRLPQRGARCDR